MSALLPLLREIIRTEGPIGIDRYMALALGHPAHGYYMTRDPLGAAGDFTTAPEISQMFGELLGLWAAEVWADMGRPATIRLVELGPGRGTLMADAVRAASILPAFAAALSVHLVDTSPVLRRCQQATLSGCAIDATWHEALETVPPGPAIVLANEFLDALPIRQFVRAGDGWHERLVGLGRGDALTFGLAADPVREIAAAGQDGDVLEIGATALASVSEVARRVVDGSGAALVIDYGHLRSALGDTLQAVQGHRFADPLAAPGEADLTAHVDFEAVGRTARAAGAALHGPATQRDFLRALSIETRAERLRQRADRSEAAAVEAALARLIGCGEEAMGQLFKVIGLSDPNLATLPGLLGGAAAGTSPHRGAFTSPEPAERPC